MKLDQLRKIIREEVRAAVKEELQDVMNEAVKYASAPQVVEETRAVPQEKSKAPSRRELAEMIGLEVPTKPTNLSFAKDKGIQSMLEQTQQSMTQEEYQTMFTGTSDMVQKPNFASSMANQMGMTGNQLGLDISQLDFVSKAKAVYDKAVEKSNNK